MAETTQLDRAEVYNPAEHIIQLDGVMIHGWVRCRCGYTDPRNVQAPTSADGKHFWIHNLNFWGVMELELSQDSPSKNYCRELFKRNQPWGAAVKDKSGTPDACTFQDVLGIDESPLERTSRETNYRFTYGGLLTFGEGGLPEVAT